jgi:hypothetical protein
MVVKLKDVRRKALKMLDSGTKLRNFLQPPGAICVHNNWKPSTCCSVISYQQNSNTLHEQKGRLELHVLRYSVLSELLMRGSLLTHW